MCRICGLKSHTVLLGEVRGEKGTQPLWAWLCHSCDDSMNDSQGKGGHEVSPLVLFPPQQPARSDPDKAQTAFREVTPQISTAPASRAATIYS